jgi:type I restriction enzyme S subunit
MSCWQYAKLSALAEITYGYTQSASVEPVGPRFLRITDIQRNGVDWSSVPFCQIDSADVSKFKLKHNDIVFARTGATTGKSFLVESPPDAVFASYLIRLRLAKPDVLPAFLQLYFQSAEYWRIIDAGSTGSAQGGFNATKLGDLQVSFPPVEEQRRIVTILDDAFEGIATAKAHAELNLRNAGDVFESFCRNLLREGSRRWPTKTLDQISTNLDSKRVPITKSDRVAGPYPYYGASGVVDHVADYLFDEETLLVSEDGANLLARSSPIAFAATGHYWVNNHAHVLKFEDKATQQFVEFYLESIPLDPYITGAAQPKLNQKALNAIPIPIPDAVKDQAHVVEQLTSLKEQSERLRELYKQKLHALTELQQSLLHQAFTGQL